MRDDDPRHGSTTGYRLGCRETCCRRAVAAQRAEQRKRYYLERTDTFMVPTLGTRRRIQALSALGWSVSEVSRRAGYERSHLGLVMRRGSLRATTARRISNLYDELSMQLPPERTKAEKIDASRARRIAAERGWLPPLAWDDIDNDPEPGADDNHADTYLNLICEDRKNRADIDEVLVERIIGGDYFLSKKATPAEKAEVARIWAGQGRSLADLARLTGMKVERYYKAAA